MAVVTRGENREVFKGVLELCVLALVSERPCYGRELLGLLEDKGIAGVGEGTVYPLLRRMEKGLLLESRLAPSDAGPARKYYALSPEGRNHLEARGASFLSLARAAVGLVERAVPEELTLDSAGTGEGEPGAARTGRGA